MLLLSNDIFLYHSHLKSQWSSLFPTMKEQCSYLMLLNDNSSSCNSFLYSQWGVKAFLLLKNFVSARNLNLLEFHFRLPGMFDHIRKLFASTPDAKERGYTAGRFSFNVSGGRCENCNGDGILKIEMNFLPDVYVPCEVCHGARYNRETLQVKYKGKNIAEVLDMRVEEALRFFENLTPIKNKLQTLYDVGLGYVKLGQSATSLSGGEAQRVKLSTELSKRNTGNTIYLLDEPTTGLATADVEKLVQILQTLVAKGNTVVVIEHNLDVIKVADNIIDLGPEGGDKGGNVVVSGTPEEVAACTDSYTGQFLKNILK